MQINKIYIFYHVTLEGIVTFNVHFVSTWTKRTRMVFLLDIEGLLDSMMSKRFREANVFKNRMSTSEQIFTVEYYKEE